MAQSAELVDVLKRALKAAGFTYARVASGLGMSEASVKRMFADKHFSLQRLDAICQLIGMEITDLLQLYEESRHRISHLSEIQEQELVANSKLLLVAVCVRNHMSYEEIITLYAIEPTECIQYLARFDRLGLIDLLPKNRIRLRIDENFRWLPGGPIERYFEKHVQEDFLRAGFTGQQQARLFLTGQYSKSSYAILRNKIDDLAAEFADLHRRDLGLPLADKTNIGLLVALRPWELNAFRMLRRER